jgi:hypothetical protein
MARSDRPNSLPSLTGADRSTHRAQRESLVTGKRPRRLMPIAAAADYLSVSRATIERLAHVASYKW